MGQWYLDPVFGSYATVAAVAGLLLWLAGLATRRLAVAPPRRRWLFLLRCAVSALVVLMLLRPTRVWTDRQAVRGSLIVLLDSSRSMTIPDVGGGVSRWEAQRRAAQAWRETLDELSSVMDVHVYRFAQQPDEVDWRAGDGWLAGPPSGQQTDLGGAIRQAARAAGGQPVLGVVLSSDGAQRALRPPVELLPAARELVRRGIPLLAVPWGRPQDPAQARDVALVSLPDQYRVFVKNDMTIAGTVRIDGYANQPISLEAHITADTADGQPPGEVDERLGPIELMATETRQQLRFEFPYVPQSPGQYRITVQAKTQPGELVVDNNQLTAFLTVLEGGVRILQLESNWFYPEPKFIARAIAESPALQLEQHLIDWRHQADWPVMFPAGELEEFDIFLVGDVHAQALNAAAGAVAPGAEPPPEATLLRIARRVEQGAGLMTTGGPHSYGPGGYADTPLADVLPVALARLERQAPDPQASLPADLHLAGPVTMLPTRDHFVIRLGPSYDQTLAAWRELEPLARANRMGTLKPSAQVLAASPDGTPLLVAGQYGLGRVLAFAGDSTHRWWLHGQSRAHRRFWQQAMLWLAGQEDLQKDQLRLALDRRRAPVGARVRLDAQLVGADGQILSADALEFKLIDPDGEATGITGRATPDGWQAELGPLSKAGEYQIQGRAMQGGQVRAEATSRLAVYRQDLELSDPAANPAQLERLAEMTREYGGRLVMAEQLPDALRQLPNQPASKRLQRQARWQPGETPADAWAFFLILLGLLATEWFLRKHWGLV